MISADNRQGKTPDQSHPRAENHPWERIFAREGRVFTDQLPALDEIAERFNAHGCQLVLDLGCGNGRHVVALSGLGFRVLGLDISRTGLELTRQWLQDSQLEAELFQSDTRHPLPLAASCLDGLISTQVIHHALLQEVRLAITEIHRILKPGGLVFVTVPRRSRSQRRSEQLEPHTYLPLEGPEAGLPHHIFSSRRLRKAFQDFCILEINSRDKGRLLSIWAQKPF